MIIRNFHNDVLKDYETNLELFFDHETNAVYEPGREDGAPKFLFTEVTGYALLDFLLLHSITGEEKYIEKANRSAEWIIRHAQDPTGGVLTRYYFERDDDPALGDKSFHGRRIYSFDTAICLRGMVAIYNHTGNPEQLESAIRMGDFLLEHMIDDDGEVVAIFDASRGEPDKPNKEVWSRCFGAFHSKVGEALIDLADAVDEEKYAKAATTLCNRLLRFQSTAGNFETSRGGTELHPHCYATEGLLHVGRMTSNREFIDAAARATSWALDQCDDGEIPQSFEFSTGSPLARFRTDALAQVLALGSDLLQMEMLEQKYQKTLDELASRILGMKLNRDGYFQYGFYERPFQGKTESNTRSYWTNMFCLRGLFKYYLSSIVCNTYVAVLAGGIGSRVWPISCENRPKPVSTTLLGDRSHLQETIRRYTHDYFIPPSRIYILCSKNAMQQAMLQAASEGVPEENCIIEHEPKGTIPAVSLALRGIPSPEPDKERFVIVTMSDNVISPYKAFQRAVTNALFTVCENECLVSIGKPADKTEPIDDRFGHMFYERKIENYHAYEVTRFIEKPQPCDAERLRELPGSLAWECGGVVFREGYYGKLLPKVPQSGNLAEDLLSRAGPWSKQEEGGIRLATALLGRGVRFEDFGVPGKNLMDFHAGDNKHDQGNNNIFLGNSRIIKLLSCSNNLVISDQLPIEGYGLDGFVVIDNSVTNTAVIMPIDEVRHLPGLYRLFSGSAQYEPFISGGPAARNALPTTFVEKSPNAHASSDNGLVFAYNFEDNLTISRRKDKLVIVNNAFPKMDSSDFRILLEKQREDPKLAEHLIQVGMLAGAVVGDGVVLSDAGQQALNLLCLYHDIGGYLDDEAERKEKELIEEFEKRTKLNRRMLDSRIIHEVIRSYGDGSSLSEEDIVGLLNDNVNSAVEFLRKRRIQDGDLRDLIITLLQIQDSPHLFSAYMSDYQETGLPYSATEVETIFSCFKIAENISNGRWLWKRRKLCSGKTRCHGFLVHNEGSLEDFPFILSFTVKWLRDAHIDPEKYLLRLNDLLVDPDSSLNRAILRIQEGTPLLLCDRIYIELIGNLKSSGNEPRQLPELAGEMFERVAAEEEQSFQYTQLLELPHKLRQLEPYCSYLTGDSIAFIHEMVADIYHKNWKSINPHVDPAVIARLQG